MLASLPMAPVMQTNVNFQIETVPPTTAGMFLIPIFKRSGVRLFQ